MCDILVCIASMCQFVNILLFCINRVVVPDKNWKLAYGIVYIISSYRVFRQHVSFVFEVLVALVFLGAALSVSGGK